MKILSLIKSSLIGVLLISSCTKLDETDVLFDTATSDNFGQTDAEIVSLLAAAYTNLYGSFGGDGSIMRVMEVPTDEVVVPQRGPDWGDGGHWIRLKTHKTRTDDGGPGNTWPFLYRGVNTCNRVLSILEPLGTPSSEKFIAELKALRAIYYYWLVDLFGNVPLSVDFTRTDPLPNSTRKEVYEFIEKELTEALPGLQKTGPNDNATYGRVNYYTAQTVLAKLYLNAEVFSGTPQWDKTIAACDDVINSGKFALMPSYKDNFKKDNKGSTEFIWVIPYDDIQATGFNLPHQTLHMAEQSSWNMGGQPWNGWASVQEFYALYIDTVLNPGPKDSVVGLDPKGSLVRGTKDRRLSNFIVGKISAADGFSPLNDAGYEVPKPSDPSYKPDPDGPQINHTPYINELEPAAWRQSGARIGKYEFYKGMTGQLSNDYVLFRYADILLTKAEALARKAGNWNEPTALALVNQIRETHGGVDKYVTMTASSFLAERGREMFFEATRRQDMIRFDTYNSKFMFHEADASRHVNLFPIPATVIDASGGKLKQNPGY